MNAAIGRIFTEPPHTDELLCVGVDTLGDGSIALVVRRRDREPSFQGGLMVPYLALSRDKLQPVSPDEG